ncbi:hypothetical protein [Micromonospora sp. KC721]|nr:hypothetical protein [Micromonospora sp. KC721]
MRFERVQTWSGRKARLFTPAHITTAYERLKATGLLPRMAPSPV